MEKEKWGENMAIPKYQYIKDELKNKMYFWVNLLVEINSTLKQNWFPCDVSSIAWIRAWMTLLKTGPLFVSRSEGTFSSCKAKLVEFSDVEIFETKTIKVTVLSIERGNDLKYLNKYYVVISL